MPRDARRRIGKPREHQMHDVLGEVVLAIGDEDLLAEEAVGAVALRARRGVVSAPRSEPACGSVRFIVAVHSPETRRGR